MIKSAKTTIALLFLACLLAVVQPAWSADRFVAGLGELPLMPGLREGIERRLIYEKADGRIVNTVARGAPNIQQIEAFYNETLPQLGWRKGSALEFVREQEILSLTIIRLSSTSEVQYKIAPE
jgi:hypothetical protein